MDATFAVPSAEKKIVKVLKKNYQVLIFMFIKNLKLLGSSQKLEKLQKVA